VLFGRYVLESDVARSATSRVVRARDRVGDRRVAVKLFFATGLRDTGRDAWTRFEREARALSELHHPAIVPLVEYVPSAPALVTEWMPGGSLADRLAEEALAPDHAAEIVDAILRALGEAHRRGILHRDVKPANVLFDASGGARLVDFGSAHVNDRAVTVTEGVLGTLAYMAPEQRTGEPASFASDVYGAGAVFHHALTGAPPAARATFLASELTPEHVAIAARLVAPAGERPESADTARRLLRSVAWPTKRPKPRTLQAAPMPQTSRLSALGDDRYHDRWLERDVRVIDPDPETLARARAFARAGHPSLAIVVARSPDCSLWIEDLARSSSKGPDAQSRADLTRALAALHRAGGCHGSIDAEHVVEQNGSFFLAFPRIAREKDADSDRRALDRTFAKRPVPAS
jgi:serine/threonine-protein kinase